MSVPSYDALKLPQGIKTILITGAGGFVGQKLTLLLLDLFPNLKIITTDIVPPPQHVGDEKRLVCVKADLGERKQCEKLFEGEKVGGVFALHGIMSGGAEADFDLGYAVNVDSHLNLLKTAHAHAKQMGMRPVYVFVSSLAVYGGPKATPQSKVVPKDTPVLANSSYGVQKQIMELYVYDYGRKGYLDTRAVRLPTVCIRSGAPSSAASSFMSGLIREPLQGEPSECPVASSASDPILDNMPVYVTRTKTVVRNIAYALCMPEAKFIKGEGRSISLPGFRITTRDILDALEEHGGAEASKLVSYKKDQAVINICETWAGDYDNTDALGMGFEVDDTETGFGLAVKDFQAELKGSAK